MPVRWMLSFSADWYDSVFIMEIGEMSE